MLGARRRRPSDVVLDWLIGGFLALTLICTWVTTPDDAGPLVLYSLFFWVIIFFVPWCVLAGLVVAIVEFFED